MGESYCIKTYGKKTPANQVILENRHLIHSKKQQTLQNKSTKNYIWVM